jgi:hypothetical protein
LRVSRRAVLEAAVPDAAVPSQAIGCSLTPQAALGALLWGRATVRAGRGRAQPGDWLLIDATGGTRCPPMGPCHGPCLPSALVDLVLSVAARLWEATDVASLS